jgi:protein-S-isoprenylcysteine O-methyltransferase Ste14
MVNTTAMWIINLIVILSLVYLSFGMALRGWIAGMRRGEAVTIFPRKGGKPQPLWVQIVIICAAFLVSIVLIWLLWIPLPSLLPDPWSTTRIILGFSLFLGGAIFILWGRRTLGRMWGISTSREVKLVQDHRLVQEGPFRLIRHPMYFGWWVVVLGLILIYYTWVLCLFFVFSLIAFLGRAKREEKVLGDTFGEEWHAYKRRTRFIIPFIW